MPKPACCSLVKFWLHNSSMPQCMVCSHSPHNVIHSPSNIWYEYIFYVYYSLMWGQRVFFPSTCLVTTWRKKIRETENQIGLALRFGWEVMDPVWWMKIVDAHLLCGRRVRHTRCSFVIHVTVDILIMWFVVELYLCDCTSKENQFGRMFHNTPYYWRRSLNSVSKRLV